MISSFGPNLALALSLTLHCPPLPPGQVFSSFGPNLSSTELLMDYGFVDSANENDKIELATQAVGESSPRRHPPPSR